MDEPERRQRQRLNVTAHQPQPEPPVRRYGCLIGCLVGIPLWLLTAFGFAYWMKTATGTVIQQWSQPQHVTYEGGPYTLYVIQGDRDPSLWSTYNDDDRRYLLVVTTGDARNVYPHPFGSCEYPFHFERSLSGNGIRQHLEGCQLDWTHEGVGIIEPTSYRSFIPKPAFIGGR